MAGTTWLGHVEEIVKALSPDACMYGVFPGAVIFAVAIYGLNLVHSAALVMFSEVLYFGVAHLRMRHERLSLEAEIRAKYEEGEQRLEELAERRLAHRRASMAKLPDPDGNH